jgi:hypothetical protein
MSNFRPPRDRQRGFTLIVVFLLIILMVGVAATVMLSSQTDLRISGQDREATTAFYAAETGLAFGKDWLNSKGPSPGNGAWNGVLGSASAPDRRCTGGNANVPGTTPVPANTQFDALPAPISYFNFCVHNNALDPNWAGGGTGATIDGDGIIAIEAYGYGPNGQVSHITAEVSASGVAVQSLGGYIYAGDAHGAGQTGVSMGGTLVQGL